MIVSAAGNIAHAQVRELVDRAFEKLAAHQRAARPMDAPRVVPQVIVANRRSSNRAIVCLGTNSYPQNHDDRYVSYIMNTVLGGSMSSRLFQNVREKRGLAYAVFSGLSAYRDAGQHHHLRRLRQRCGHRAGQSVRRGASQMKRAPVPDTELRRAKDHLKGSLMLSLENTASRMSHLARQEIYFDRHFGLDETLAGVERVTSHDVQRSRTISSPMARWRRRCWGRRRRR